MLNFCKMLLMLLLVWMTGFSWYIYDLMHLNKSCDVKADGIVVLTGGRGRIEKGFDLLSKHKANRLLISGVHSDYKVKKMLSVQMMPFLDQIELGYAASTTIENSYEAFFWAHKYAVKNLYLVTADYHMRRAQLNFALTLPHVKIYSCPVIVTEVSTLNKDILIRLCYEYHKLIATWFRIQIEQFVNKGTNMNNDLSVS